MSVTEAMAKYLRETGHDKWTASFDDSTPHRGEYAAALEFARELVRRGALLLDDIRSGWAAEIDLAKFKFDSVDRCVLGQLWGWDAGLAAVDAEAAQIDPLGRLDRYDVAEWYGFDQISCIGRVDPCSTEYEVAWKEAIQQRLENPGYRECALCGQHITDGKPCGCGAR